MLSQVALHAEGLTPKYCPQNIQHLPFADPLVACDYLDHHQEGQAWPVCEDAVLLSNPPHEPNGFTVGFCANQFGPNVYCSAIQCCPPGYLKVARAGVPNDHECRLITDREDEPPNEGPPDCPAGTNPIHTLTGNKYQRLEVYQDQGLVPLDLTLHYNSRASGEDTQRWRHNHQQRLEAGVYARWLRHDPRLEGAGLQRAQLHLRRPDGRLERYTNTYDPALRNTVNVFWTAWPNLTGRLESLTDASGTWAGLRYTDAQDTVETYDLAGNLLRVTNRQGLSHHYSYNGNQTVVSDDFGRTLTLTQTANALEVQAPDGTSYQVQFNTEGDVAAVVYPDGGQTTLGYTDTRFPGSLTALTDPTGVVTARWSYDAQNRAISSEHAGGSDRYQVSYSGNPDAAVSTQPSTVTDPLGQTRTYQFTAHFGKVAVTGIAGGACPHCGSASAGYSYDANGFVAQRTDWNGVVTTTSRDALGRILNQTEAVGTPEQRTTSTTWHPQYRLPLQVTTPGQTTSYTHDAAGNVLTRTDTDTDTDTATGEIRTERSTYNATGQVLTQDGPRTDVNDVTTLSYYPANDACVGCRGQLQTQTNAVGHVTQYTSYNGRGQVTALTAPNGQVTTWDYDLRGRLLRQTVGSDVTAYTYDLAGRLLTQTAPDGTTQSYTYDAQDRLSEVWDATGNTTRHSYNALGQRTQTALYDQAGVLTLQQTHTYDTQGRLQATTDGLGRSTAYAYDPQGQLLSSTDPSGRTTTHSYDPLGRRSQSRDPLSGTLTTTYDPQDQPLRITDPRGLSTTYDPNAWGEVQRLDSPDTRSTVTSYDPAGNPLQQIDARGVSVTQAYDALNRNTTRLYPDSQQQFRYDRSTNGKGLLTDVQDSSGSQSYTYSQRRQVARQSITLNGLAPQTLSYGYGKGGRLSRITYPSGRTATYSYRADGTLSQLRTSYGGTTQTVVKTTWNPTGQPTKLTYGNGLVEKRSYDLAGQLTQLNRNALGKLDYRYDLAGNITQIGTQTYGYDALDRLTSAPSRSYSYDANGNRLQDSGQSYILAPDSNRLMQAVGRSYDYDAVGNPLSDGRYQYHYDGQNRLAEVKQSTTVIARYTYNALGQRVRKESPATGTTHYLYSTEGQLLAELDAVGNTQREYLYLQGWPVAVVSYSPPVAPLAADELPEAALDTVEDYPETAETSPVDAKPTPVTSAPSTGSTDRASDGAALSTATTPSIQLHYLHPDHLGTPRLATDSTQRIVWRWDSAPFGDTPALEDPDGDGARVTVNLRFPGQYFDTETGLHYNYFRDYDPVTGRYVESDPIGLRGGVGTYGYVNGRPLVAVDPEGLKAKGQWINGTPRIGNEYIVPTGANLLHGWPKVDDWGFVHVLRVHGKAGGRLFCSVRCIDEDDCSSMGWEMHNSYGFSVTGHVDVGPNIYGSALGLLFRSPWSNVQVNLSLSLMKGIIAGSALYTRYQRAIRTAHDALLQYGPDRVCNSGWPSIPRI